METAPDNPGKGDFYQLNSERGVHAVFVVTDFADGEVQFRRHHRGHTVHHAPLARFRSEFSPITPERYRELRDTYEPILVELEMQEIPPFQAFSNGEKMNGLECPRFTKEGMLAVANSGLLGKDTKEGTCLYFDEALDAFVFYFAVSDGISPPTKEEIRQIVMGEIARSESGFIERSGYNLTVDRGTACRTPQGPAVLYDIASAGFTWMAAEEQAQNPAP
jgi:hypothetical protein